MTQAIAWIAHDDVHRPIFAEQDYRIMHDMPLMETEERRAIVELLSALREGTLSASGLLSEVPIYADGNVLRYDEFSRVREDVPAEDWGLLHPDWKLSTLTGQGRQYANILLPYDQLLHNWPADDEPDLSTPIPAADRIVTVDHNKPEYIATLHQFDNLIEDVRASNEFVGDPEDKQRIVAELSAARRLLDSAKVRATQIIQLGKPALTWVADNFAKETVRELAKSLAAWLVKLFLS